MKTWLDPFVRRVAGVGVALVVLTASPVQAQFVLLRSFTGSDSDGYQPEGTLTLSGSTLYGCHKGGSGGKVFKINTDGSGFANLHSFAGGTTDGSWPNDMLTLSGSTLYGTTIFGGASGNGTVFKVNVNGTGFGLVHSFAGGPSDGLYPDGSLALSGTTLFGTAMYGGSGGDGLGGGVVYKVDVGGSGHAILHNFAGGASDGEEPLASLVVSGSALYGTTQNGGSSQSTFGDDGVLFTVDTNGSGYAHLHDFNATVDFLNDVYPRDGGQPWGTLTLSGSTLYGMTSQGGNLSAGHVDAAGTVFKVSTGGSGYTILHRFNGGAGDGLYPQNGALTLSGSTLYGMTLDGGVSNMGVVFMVGTDGSGYANLHEFTGGPGDGAYPYGGLTLSGSTLYGMTSRGGAGDMGVVFALTIPSTPWTGAVDVGGGWKWLSWFGFFVDAGNGWVYHNEHGWMYGAGATPSSIWLWTSDMGWLWTNSTTYPSLYRSSEGAWLWYQVGTDNPRWFYNFTTAVWESH